MVRPVKMLATKPKVLSVSCPGFTWWGGYFIEGLNGFLFSSTLRTCSVAHTYGQTHKCNKNHIHYITICITKSRKLIQLPREWICKL